MARIDSDFELADVLANSCESFPEYLSRTNQWDKLPEPSKTGRIFLKTPAQLEGIEEVLMLSRGSDLPICSGCTRTIDCCTCGT